MNYKPYVYHIFDTVTNMYYIGSKTSKNCTPENTNNYYGSPKCKVYREVIKTRPETLVKTIVAVCQTKEDTIAFEARLHKELDVKNDPMSYNKANQTTIGFTSTRAGIKLSVETKSKISSSLTSKVQSEATKLKRSRTMTGRKHSNETKEMLRLQKTGVKHTDEHRKNNAAAQLGRKLSEETRAKMSASQSARQRKEQTKQAATG